MEMVTFDGFLGTFYSNTKDENLKSDPDTVEAYVPKGTNDMKFTDKDGKEEICYPVKDGRKTVYYPLSYMQDLNSQGRVEGPIE